jgi:hypothetical protein
MAAKKVVKTEIDPKVKVVVKKAITKIVKAVHPVKVAVIEQAEPVEAPKSDMKIDESKPRSSVDRGSLLLGATLLVIGAVWILGQFLEIPLAGYLWPLAIVLPGVFVFISALNMESVGGDALAVLGSILTSVGLLLFVQQLTNTWASWAYAWALIAPTSIGIGQIIYGNIKKHESLVKTGLQMVKVGLWIFVIGFIFFELIIGLNGFGISRFGLPVIPVVLIGLGVLILIRTITFRHRE